MEVRGGGSGSGDDGGSDGVVVAPMLSAGTQQYAHRDVSS